MTMGLVVLARMCPMGLAILVMGLAILAIMFLWGLVVLARMCRDGSSGTYLQECAEMGLVVHTSKSVSRWV